MTENETPVGAETVAAPVSFDTWRAAINHSVEGFKNYLVFGRPLGLNNAAENLAAEFPSIVEQLLAGMDADSDMATDMRNTLEFAHDICPDPWRAAFVTWAKESDALRALIAKAKEHPSDFTYHGFIGDVTEAFGRALLSAPGEHPVISPYYNAEKPDAVQYKTRLSDGTWEDISQQELLALVRDPNGPHIVHSANHAFLDNQKFDLDSLQDQFSKLFEGSRLPTAHDSGHLSTWDKEKLGPEDTITVFATHTRENRFLNLGQLFHRLDEVERAHENPKADTFHNAAPIAVDMVEVLLKSIVIDADVDKIKSQRDASGKPIFFNEPIALRPDALDIIRRQRYRGFSKGGNDFRDAMRLLVHTLDTKDLVQSPEGFTTKDIISNLSIIVFGLNEKPMADYYRQQGVNVPIVSSKNDITAPPSVRHDDDEPAYNYVGGTKKGDDGHSPVYSVEGMLADWRIHDLLRMHGAVSQGQAAITDINFVKNEDGSYDPDALTLSVAQGTTDVMMQKVITPLNDALHAAGLSQVSVARVGPGQGRNRYRIQGEGIVLPENIEKIQAVFRTLCAQHGKKDEELVAERPEIPLWVSQCTAYGKTSLMRRNLLDEKGGKIEPSKVVENVTVAPYVCSANARDLRQHPRMQRSSRVLEADGVALRS